MSAEYYQLPVEQQRKDLIEVISQTVALVRFTAATEDVPSFLETPPLGFGLVLDTHESSTLPPDIFASGSYYWKVANAHNKRQIEEARLCINGSLRALGGLACLPHRAGDNGTELPHILHAWQGNEGKMMLWRVIGSNAIYDVPLEGATLVRELRAIHS